MTIMVIEAGAPSALMDADQAYRRMDGGRTAESKAYALGMQAVIWSMQWVKGNRVMHSFTAPLPPGARLSPVDPGAHATNIWRHERTRFTDAMRMIETANTETLYSNVVVDLAGGPVVVVHPDLGERYFRTSLWELHGDTHTISQKQDGGHPPPYALLPRDWDGDLPADVRSIRVHSRYLMVSAHLGVYGDDDVPNVNAVQDGFALIGLRDWGHSNRPLEEGPPMRPLRRPGTSTPAELLYFEELGETLKDLTVRDDEAGFARQLGDIGMSLTDGFRYDRLDPETVAGLARAVLDAQSVIEHKARTLAPVQPGGTWQVSFDLSNLDDWLFRAAVGWKHVWGDSPSELLFPTARADADGVGLHGSNRYVVRFPPGELPAARYWRITMYDLAGFLVANPINRFGIGTMAEKLEPDRDGGLTLLIQHESPGADRETNWLPAPADGFFLMMRMYQPDDRMYRREYVVPPVRRLG